MQHSKYIQLLKTLNASERKEFNKYLNALYGKQKKAIQVNTYIQKFAKYDFVHKKLEDEYVRSKVFKDKSFEGKGLSNPMSDLNVYLEEFLRWKKVNRNAKNYERDKLQLEIYKERKLDDLFLSELEHAKTRVKEAPLDMWQKLRLTELDSLLHYSSLSPKMSKRRTTLIDLKDNLDRFYRNFNAKLSCEIAQRKQILSVDSQDFQTDFKEKDEFFYVYKAILDLTEEKSGTTFEETKTFLFNRLNLFSILDQSIILEFLINYSSWKLKRGDMNSGKNIFEIYKYKVENDLFLKEGKIFHIPFNNIMEVSCKTGEIDWAERFFQNYKDLIDPVSLSEDSIKLAKGILLFAKGEYHEVIWLLNEPKFTDLDHAMRARFLLLCSHFGCHPKSSSFKYFCNAYEIFFKRNDTVNPITIEGALNLLKYIKLINKQYDKVAMFNEVLYADPLYYKVWLLKKIDPTFHLN